MVRTSQAIGNLQNGISGSIGVPEVAPVQDSTASSNQTSNVTAFELRKRLAAIRADASDQQIGRLEQAMTDRQEFWLDTCRDLVRRKTGYKQVLDLYQKHGCRFCEPTHSDVQGILDALDSALPFWDRDHPELFYQTLELNFGELVRHG